MCIVNVPVNKVNTMIAASKEKINRDNTRSQSAKCERDPHRVCPTKLTKQELEDLYFALMDTNMELKRTVNTQQDNIKMLNTKVHRLLTAQRSCMKENQCCPQTKAVVSEQKDIIADLKKANDRMSDRIRILNMRLCSAKQFLRRTPSLANSRCTKCCLAPPASLKNSSISMLQTKKSESERKPSDSSAPAAEKDPASTRTVETETEEQEKESPNTVCKENRCRTQMEELKQKITDLQEESSKYHSEYSNRISRLESEMSALQAENTRVKSERAATLQSLELTAQKEMQLAARLRDADAQCNEISSQLLVEKNKVAELETRVKAADMASQAKRHSVTIATQDVQLKNSDVMLKDMEPRRSTSHTEVAPSKSNDSIKEMELQHSTSRVHIQDTQPESGDAMAKEMEIRPSTSIHAQDKQPKSGDLLAKGIENRQNTFIIERRKSRDSVDKTANTDHTKAMEKRLSNEENRPETQDNHPTPHKPCGHCVTGSPSYVILTDTATPSPAKSKHSDDSGYIDNQTEEEKSLAKINVELVKKITDLQEQLDALRIASAALKAEQSSKATETNTANVDNRTNDGIKHEASARDSKTSRDSKDYTKSSENEIKKEAAERATKEMEHTESPAIHRANQLWAQYSADDLQQREDRIQFSNLNRQENSVSNTIADQSKAEEMPDKDLPLRMKRTERKKSLDENNLFSHERNEIVDKIVDGDGKVQDIDKNEAQDYRQDVDVNDAFKHDDVKPRDDLKLDFNTQTETKTGVKIQDNDVFVPGVDKRVTDKMRKRDSIIDHAVRDKINEIKDLKAKEKPQSSQTRNSTDDDAASDSLHSPADSVRIQPKRVSVVAHDPRPQTASPENTDHEISHLSDLPPEHDVSGSTPRNQLSPGEQKTTTSYTDTYTEPSTDPLTMSEGEVLVNSGRKRSLGETKDEAVETKIETAAVSQKMEQALQSIGEELARCRELLQNTRAPEIVSSPRPTRETSTTCPSRVALKHSTATPQLVQPSSAHSKCTFTLHIGTLVLSDEAVVYSREKSLLLTWKFYDQNVAMTRMRSGRVILFDFTTEYDAILDERFTDYLKFEEMPIVICELNKQNCPFATCALPFRDVLLNPNHRVDMSLALTVGPDLRRAEATHSVDSLVTSDEVGVLDLWCMLRKRSSQCETRRPLVPTPDDNDNNILDKRSDEYRMSEEQYSHTSQYSNHAPTVGHPPHPTLGPTPKRISRPSLLLDDGSLAKYSVHEDRLSSVIPNEVPTNIRSSGEMRKALDDKRNAQSNDYHSSKGLEKLEDDVLSRQPHQSVSSWARFLRRQSRCHKKARKSPQISEVNETLENSFKQIESNKTNTHATPEAEEPTDQGEDKASQKKAVTINPRYSHFGWEQPQQDPDKIQEVPKESIVITILWLALNEECGAMTDSSVQRLYVAFSVLGRSGADFETPVSLPKPRSYVEKCIFNFRKSIQLRQCDLPQLGHMGRCKSNDVRRHNPKDCIVFTVISEPAEDPLGLASCEDIGYAYLYLGDVLSISDSDTYVEVVAVHSARREDVVCGVLCVQMDGLELVRKAKLVHVTQ